MVQIKEPTEKEQKSEPEVRGENFVVLCDSKERKMARSAEPQPRLPFATLIEQVDALDDPRKAYVMVEQALAECRQKGEPAPKALLTLRQQLRVECIAESQGR